MQNNLSKSQIKELSVNITDHSIKIDQRLVDFACKAFAILKECNIKYSDKIQSITINNRLRTSWGMCRKKKAGGEQVFVIELNKYLLESSENAVMDTLLHEILHTCYNSFNHGKTWQRYAERLNRKYGFHIKRTQNYTVKEISPQQIFKYFVKCKNCGNVIGKARLSKVITNPENYRCARCKGELMRWTP